MFQEIKEALEIFFKDKYTRDIAEFKKIEEKPIELSASYFAIDSAEEKYILKQAYKNLDDEQKTVTTEKEGDRARTVEQEQLDFLTEYITAPLYTRLLYNRAPQIELTIDQQSDLIYIRSKFLPGISLSQFSGGDEKNNTIVANSKNLKDLNGFEKIIIVSALLGDNDYGPTNLLVNTEDNNTISKIDHGASRNFFQNMKELITSIRDNIEYWEYQNIRFDIINTKKYIEEELSNLSDEEIKNFVENRIWKLKNNGFESLSNESLSIEDYFINGIIKHKSLLCESLNSSIWEEYWPLNDLE